MINTFKQMTTTLAASPTTRGAVDWAQANEQTLYTVLWVLIIAMLVVAVLTVSIQKKFHEKNQKYAMKPSSSGKTGAQVALDMLQKNGITDVKVIKGREGHDHFDPTTKTVSLSPSTYDSSSVSAMAIAGHEVGHAIQWHKKSILVRVRSILTTPVSIVAGVGQMMFSMGGLLMILLVGIEGWIFWITIAGVLAYSAAGLFQLVTLPLEFNASSRAMKNLKEMGYIQPGTDDEIGAKGVLKAAAMTYVIAFISTMITLLFFIIRLLLILANNRR